MGQARKLNRMELRQARSELVVEILRDKSVADFSPQKGMDALDLICGHVGAVESELMVSGPELTAAAVWMAASDVRLVDQGSGVRAVHVPTNVILACGSNGLVALMRAYRGRCR